MFTCDKCARKFLQKRNLKRHNAQVHNGQVFNCSFCHKEFSRKENMIRHIKICPKSQKGTGIKRSRESSGEENETSRQSKKAKIEASYEPREVESALSRALVTYRLDLTKIKEDDVNELLKEAIMSKKESINKNRNANTAKAIKFFMILELDFYQASDCTIKTDPPVSMHSETYEVYQETDLEEILNFTYDEFINRITEYTQNGSGWVIGDLLQLDTTILELDPLRASGSSPLPKKIKDKKACINIYSKDQRCFLWSVIAGLYPVEKHVDRVSSYKPHEQDFNVAGLDFPMPIKQIGKFEEMNNVSVSVYGYNHEEETVFPLRISGKVVNEDAKARHVDLLMLQNGEESHYVLIKNFSRLVSSQVSKYKNARHFCRFCLHGFTKKELLDRHIDDCSKHEPQRTVLPKDMTVKFRAIKKQLQAPFVCYADFECTLDPLDEAEEQKAFVLNGKPEPHTKYQQHKPASFAYKIISNVEGYHHDMVMYSGEDADEMFLARLQEDVEEIFHQYIEEPVKMDELTDTEKYNFELAESCHICGKRKNPDEIFVRDHCHVSGKYRGPAHVSCNLAYALEPTKWKIPVILHNAKNYDTHLIVQAIKEHHGKVSVVANNMEKYVTFSIDRLKFVDSYQMMMSSLSELADNLTNADFHQLSMEFPDPEDFLLLRKKGVFPYDWFSNLDKLKESKLPSREEFYSKLNDEEISDQDYEHAQNVFNHFKSKKEEYKFKDYHDLYLKQDVLLLADIFEKFRKTCHLFYKIDPAHYFTAPGFAWDAMLKMTDCELELLPEKDMYLFLENPNGGISMISHRYSKANNKYVPNYDPEKPSTYIMYYDANSLYSGAMRKYLPKSNFHWMTEEEWIEIDWDSLSDECETGYILEVDIIYPEELHNLHNQYPLAPEKLHIKPEMLSPFQKQHFPHEESTKLTPNLHHKHKYRIHYQALKLYLKLGLKIKTIHRVLAFHQEPWMKEFIDFNISQRAVATNEFEKMIFKLFNNSSYGKTMEDIRKRMSVELVTNNTLFKKRVAKPTFKTAKRFNDNLVGVNCKIATVKLCKPIYAGFAVLDLSKVEMFKFHYQIIKERYPTSNMLFTDTDSLAYEIQTDDIYKDMEKFKDAFDFSNYPKTHPLYSVVNKKLSGKFKDEMGGQPIVEFVGLRPKMYSYTFVEKERGDIEEKKVAKGTKKSVKKRFLSHAFYMDTLSNLSRYVAVQNTIRSQGHIIRSLNTRKIALSAFDTKRWICNDGVATLAHGHYKTKESCLKI